MTKQNWKLGIGISIGVAIIVMSQKYLITDDLNYSDIVVPLLYVFAYNFFSWYIHLLLLQNPRYQTIIGNRFISGLFSIIIVAIGLLLINIVLPNFNNSVIFKNLDENTKVTVGIFRCFVLSGFFYFICYHLHLISLKQKSTIEIQQLKQARLEASLSSLKEQLSPHFLFNTLNTLSSLTSEISVKKYVAQLAEVYRYLLQYKDKNTTSVEEELNFIESYIYILKTRMEDTIEIDVAVDEIILKSNVPPLTLQILLENAIKHNIASTSKKLKIRIYNFHEEYLVLENNYQPKASVQISTGTGLNNIIQRYELLFNREIIIENTPEVFTVKLPLV